MFALWHGYDNRILVRSTWDFKMRKHMETSVDIPCYENLITNNIYNNRFQEHRLEYVLCFLDYLLFTISKKKKIEHLKIIDISKMKESP